jgi:hypothetical protein
MITLTTEAAELIRDDKQLFIKIQIALGVSERTMYNYVNNNAQDLTKVSSLNELVAHTGRPLSELISGSDKLSKLLAK